MGKCDDFIYLYKPTEGHTFVDTGFKWKLWENGSTSIARKTFVLVRSDGTEYSFFVVLNYFK